MRNVEVSEIWVADDGRLFARLADTSLALTHISRASTSGVQWDEQFRAIRSPVPREWSYADWFVRMAEDAHAEYGVDLVLAPTTIWRDISAESRAAIEVARGQMPASQNLQVDDRTMAGYAGDDRLRTEARDLFNKKQWKAVLDRLEALQYPQFMDAADTRRLEIARERSRTK